jgi:hypothetical protein
MTVSNAAMDNDQVPSLYYPPRARWYSKLWRPWYALKRRLRLDAIPSPFELPVHKLVMGIVVPGLSFRLYGQPLVGWLVLAGYGLAALVFVIWIGYRPSTVALTAMISIHASSILHMQRRWLADMQLWLRIAWSVLLFVAVSACIYAPLCGLLERWWFMPLRIGERVYVIRTSATPRLVRRGDWIAYRIMAQDWGEHGAAVRIGEGYGIGQVLAVAGDKVSFSENGFSVNQELLPDRPHMPTQGAMTVAEGDWFVWPDVAILEQRANAGTSGVTVEAMKQLSTVRESEFVGVPFHRWWWRKQPMP